MADRKNDVMQSPRQLESYFLKKFIYLFIFLTFGGTGSLLLHAGFLQLQRARATLQMRSTEQASHRSGFVCRVRASVVVVYGLSDLVACETISDQGSNLCLLHWQADSLPLSKVIFISQMSVLRQQVLCMPCFTLPRTFSFLLHALFLLNSYSTVKLQCKIPFQRNCNSPE